jgi:hypothetical protein
MEGRKMAFGQREEIEDTALKIAEDLVTLMHGENDPETLREVVGSIRGGADVLEGLIKQPPRLELVSSTNGD